MAAEHVLLFTEVKEEEDAIELDICSMQNYYITLSKNASK
jgi:hypothetical protein